MRSISQWYLKTFLLTAVTLSGVASLIYEIVWARQLEAIFGTAIYSIIAILCSFFAGLALGSFICGELIDSVKTKSRLKNNITILIFLYAGIELCIGLYGFFTPHIFSAVDTFQIPVINSGHDAYFWLTLQHFVTFFIVLIIPTALMGATLPLISKILIRKESLFGSSFSLIYGLNTLGGVCGVFLAGFYLIPTFGLQYSLRIAVLLNGLIALISFGAGVLERKNKKQDLKQSDFIENKTSDSLQPQDERVLNKGILYLAIFISGFGALALEVLWTRALQTVVGSSTYAFSAVLMIFLFGNVCGIILAKKFVDRAKFPLRTYMIVQFFIGVTIFLATLVYHELPIIYVKLFQMVGGQFNKIIFIQLVLIAGVLMPTTILMGFAYPYIIKICSKNISKTGSSVGRIYALSTTGSVLGPILAGFVLIPLLGVQKSLNLLSILFMFMSLLIMYLMQTSLPLKGLKIKSTAAFGVVLLSMFLINPWDYRMANTNYFLYAPSYQQSNRKQILEARLNRKYIYQKEGLTAKVAVTQSRAGSGKLIKSMRINGKADASTNTDLQTQVILGSLPILLHPQAKDVLVVGLGSGITAGSALRHPVEIVHIVEIEAAVVEAANYFKEENYDALNDKRVTLHVDDARHYMKTTQTKYDVITAEPSNPWISKVSNLFTLEQFLLYRKHLNENGLVMQWIHLYEMDYEDIRTIAATFQQVFPHVVLWQSPNFLDVFFVGSLNPLESDFQQLKQRMRIPAVYEDLRRVQLEDPYILANHIVLGSQSVKEMSRGAKLNTDDHPILEFQAPKSIYANTVGSNAQNLLSFRQSERNIFKGIGSADQEKIINFEQAHQFRTLAALGIRNGMPGEEAIRLYQKALQVNSQDRLAKIYLSELLYEQAGWFMEQGLLTKAKKIMQEAIILNDQHADFHQELGKILLKLGDYEQAIESLKNAVHLNPDDRQAKTYIDQFSYLVNDNNVSK